MTPNPFLDSRKPDSGSEQIVQAKPAALDEAVEKAYIVYEGLDFSQVPDNVILSLEGLEKQILSPSQIDRLLQIIRSEAEPEKLDLDNTGLYLTKLIQDSYDAGNNDFMLTTGDTLIPCIGQEIKGRKTRKLRLQISGNAGDACALWAEHINVAIFGNARFNCGAGAEHSEITVFGNVREWCGGMAHYSNFNVFVDVGEWCGYTASNTIFTAHNEKAYGVFKQNIEKNSGNTIRLLDHTGKVVKEENL